MPEKLRTLLAIGYVWPEPESSAAGSHMLSILQFFQRCGWRVVFSTPAKPTEFMTDLAQFGIESRAIELNNVSFNDFVRDLQPDVVLFDRFMMEEQFGWRVTQECPNAIRILDTEDLQCLRHARHSAHKQSREVQAADFFQDIAFREIAAIARSDLSLIISSYEMELLQTRFKLEESILFHLPFLIDKPDGSQPGFSARQHFVTIGNFRHAPNWDSVLYLRELWPEIRKQLPAAELHIYGAYTPPKATALNDPNIGFLIKDRAENAHQVIRNARVLLAPLRFGAGIKGKLMDAMVTRTPSVTTPIGAEGMHGELAWPGFVTESPQEFITRAIELYQDQTIWDASVARIDPILNAIFCKDALLERLSSRVDSLIADLDSHRQGNFLGAMMRHQHMNSSEFMSRWIETKTQLAQRLRSTDE